MLQFILTTVLMASLGTMLYIVARSLPRVGEEASGEQGLFDRLYSSELPEKIDAAFNSFLLKWLRKSKVVLLRIENFVNEKLKKISSNGNGKPKRKIDFKELTDEVSIEEEVVEVEKKPGSDDN